MATPWPTPVLFPFEPDGGDPVEETITYITNVITGQDDTEQRIGLRQRPSIGLKWKVSAADRGEASRLMARIWSERNNYWLVPHWPSKQRVTSIVGTVYHFASDTGLFALADSVLVWRSTSQMDVMDIGARGVGSYTLTGTTSFAHDNFCWVIPLFPGTMDPTMTVSHSPHFNVVTVDFDMDMVNTDVPAALVPAQTFEGIGVMPFHPSHDDGSSQSSWSWTSEAVGSALGRRMRRPLAPTPLAARPLRLVLTEIGEVDAFRGWLQARRGRKHDFWIPTYQDDLQLTVAAPAGQTYIDTEACGFLTRYFVTPARTRLAILLPPETVVPVKVSGVTFPADGVERLHFLAGLPSPVPLRTRVSFLTRVRLEDDVVTLQHVAPGVATADFSVREVPRGVEE
jgi:hypothetical protein